VAVTVGAEDRERAGLAHLDGQRAQVGKHVPEGYHGLLRDVPVCVEAGDPGAARFTGARASDVGCIPLHAATLRAYGMPPAKADANAVWRQRRHRVEHGAKTRAPVARHGGTVSSRRTCDSESLAVRIIRRHL
jgi:hypothetical protein